MKTKDTVGNEFSALEKKENPPATDYRNKNCTNRSEGTNRLNKGSKLLERE